MSAAIPVAHDIWDEALQEMIATELWRQPRTQEEEEYSRNYENIIYDEFDNLYRLYDDGWWTDDGMKWDPDPEWVAGRPSAAKLRGDRGSFLPRELSGWNGWMWGGSAV
jgi:hypothetical protein